MNKLYKYKDGKRISVLKKIECPICRVEFSPRTSKNIYCSRVCYYAMKKIRGDRVVWTDEMRKKVSKKLSGKNNWNYGNPRGIKGYKRPEISGEKHWNYKKGYYITKDGYKEFGGKKDKIHEHRRVLEDYLDRKLLSTEIVHHINEDKLDNRIENLMICTRAEHINIHRDALVKGLNN